MSAKINTAVLSSLQQDQTDLKPANESDVFEQQRQNNSLEPKRTGDEDYLIFKIISVKLQE